MARAEPIVILGGGFAGVTLAQLLERRLRTCEIVLISQENYITFNPLLPEVVGASIFPAHAIAPMRNMLSRTRLLMGQVQAIDRAQQTVHYNAGSSITGMQHYGQLVLALGQRAALGFIPGMDTHGMPLKLLGDALKIRQRLVERLEQANLTADPEQQRLLCQFVVVGGGFSGVEIAGEMADFLRTLVRYYPRIEAGVVDVTVVHSSDQLLPELAPALGRRAYRAMCQRGIHFLLNRRVIAAEADGIQVRDPDGNIAKVPAGLIVCTIGNRPNPLIEQLDLPLSRGRVTTDATLRVPQTDDLWALGDCAAVINAHDNQPSPPTAQFAIAQAKQLAANLARYYRGESLRPFHYRSRGMMATVGHNKGVAKIFGIPLWGLPAWLLWRAYYLAKMPTLGRKLRIYVEWTWGMLFPHDITHLRFTGSQEADAGEDR